MRSEASHAARPLLALDMDDVLVATNKTIIKWHNEVYGTDLVPSDSHYYHYWKNRGWGSPEEAMEKINRFLDSPAFQEAPPVDGAIEGVANLRKLGLRLAIVTARGSKHKELTQRWIARHFPDCFEAIYFTGEFMLSKEGSQAEKKMGKAEMIQAIGAIALVDDAMENSMSIADSNVPIPVFLFGPYEWNRRHSKVEQPKDKLSFAERQSQDASNWWDVDVISDSQLPSAIRRVSDWSQVVVEVCRTMLLYSK